MLSLVIPVYNEEKLIDELLKRSIAAVESFTDDYELIFVDDGSFDATLEMLLSWQKLNPSIKILSLSRNFGHQAAFTAGLEYSQGEFVAMMDGDLQDPPELLKEMHRLITEENFDVVSGRRTGRKGSSSHRRSAFFFHMLFRNIGEVRDMENYGNFSMMKRDAADALLSMKEKIRYLPGLRTFIGFNQGYVDFIREERFRGKPKMTIRKLFILAFDAIFSFSKFPVQLCMFLGLAGTIIFLIAGIYYLVTLLFGLNQPAWSATLLSIFFLGSIQLLFIGIIGEYIFRNYKESQNRPVYFIKKIFDNSRVSK
jgi:dolichol-phosphate mannosyltransferase